MKTTRDLDEDTFLVTLYCLIDDLHREVAPRKPTRPGPPPTVSDAEVLTLALLAQWFPDLGERAFLRLAARRWAGYFPHLLSQSQFNRRVRDLWGVLSWLGPRLAREAERVLGTASAYEVIDGAPLPLMRRRRGERGRLFGAAAAFGRGGNDKSWYYGLKLVATVTPQGLVSGFLAGPANTEERWLAEALLRWRRDPGASAPRAEELATALGPAHRHGGARFGPSGPLGPRWGAGQPGDGPLLGDLAYRGRAWRRHWRAAYGAVVLTNADAGPAARSFRGWRQRVESAFARLDGWFGLAFARARGVWGLWARLGAKVAAHNALLFVNLVFGRPGGARFHPLT